MASDSEDEPEQMQFKVILLGDGTVGKTSLAHRFISDQFGKSYKQTVGVDFFMKQITLPSNVNIAIQLWDIGGQTIGGKMVSKYIGGSAAVFLCYDITNYQSYQNLEDWYNVLIGSFEGKPMPKVYLIANKSDLMHMKATFPERKDIFDEGQYRRRFVLSAKTGDGVTSAFYSVAGDLAGIKLTDPEMEVISKVVKAEIVNHKASAAILQKKAKRSCSIM